MRGDNITTMIGAQKLMIVAMLTPISVNASCRRSQFTARQIPDAVIKSTSLLFLYTLSLCPVPKNRTATNRPPMTERSKTIS